MIELKNINKSYKDLHVLKNINLKVHENEIIAIFNEIVGELKVLGLREKIKFLEDKVSINLDEKLYSELLSLRNQLKGG